MPTSKSALTVKNALVEPFLTAYQSNNPMIPFMCHDLKKLIKSLLELFVKPEVLAVKNTSKEMQEIDLDDKTNLPVTSSALKNFKEGVQIFLVTMLKKFFERCPLTSDILRGVSVFDPSIISSIAKPRAENLFKVLLTQLIDLKILSPSLCDVIMGQFSVFVDTDCKRKKVFTPGSTAGSFLFSCSEHSKVE